MPKLEIQKVQINSIKLLGNFFNKKIYLIFFFIKI